MEQRGPSRDQRRDAVESHGTRLERCHRGFSSAGEVDTGAATTSAAAAASTTEFHRSKQSDRVQFSVLADAGGDDGPFTHDVPLGSDVAGAAGTRRAQARSTTESSEVGGYQLDGACHGSTFA